MHTLLFVVTAMWPQHQYPKSSISNQYLFAPENQRDAFTQLYVQIRQIYLDLVRLWRLVLSNKDLNFFFTFIASYLFAISNCFLPVFARVLDSFAGKPSRRGQSRSRVTVAGVRISLGSKPRS
jgi:hypothetical protein